MSQAIFNAPQKKEEEEKKQHFLQLSIPLYHFYIVDIFSTN